MITPTPQQADALAAIRKLTVNGAPPSYTELQAELGLSSRSQVHYLLHRMKERGLIDFEYGRARSIRVIEGADAIDLDAMSNEQLARLRNRIEAIMVNRWNP